jgi:XRE family transcriptional regulator, regulator of sulfur utilization
MAVTAEHASVGSRVKALREAMGLSLRDLAERTGVSAPMLSQVERGDTSPTLNVAGRIADGLELSLSQLLRLDEGEGVSIVREHERRSGGSRKHSYEIITPPLPGQRAELSLHTLKPHASTGGPGDPPMHEAGSRETAVVMDGSVTLTIAGQEYRLAEGDSVTFDADLPHHFENPDTQADARFMSVVSAGLRRS